MATMIQFQAVSRHYPGDITALQDVTLSVAKGELVFLSGPSGAGKSTLLKLIAAIERPSSGTVSVNGQDIGSISRAGIPYLRRNLGLIMQQQSLLTDRSVLANVMLPMRVVGTAHAEAESRARAALDKVGLLDREKANPIALSGGEQQRLAIARAVVNRPAILLADEPAANLDAESAAAILEIFRAFHQVGVTLLIATHNPQWMASFSPRVLQLERGHLLGDAA